MNLDLRDYEIENTIGQGSFAIVRRCVHRKDGGKVAIKSLLGAHLDNEDSQKRLRREIEILKQLKDIPGVIQLLAHSENLDDARVSAADASTNYGTEDKLYLGWYSGKEHRSYIKFNISSLPPQQEIVDAGLYLYFYAANDQYWGKVHHVYDKSWCECSWNWIRSRL